MPRLADLFKLRQDPPRWEAYIWGVCGILAVLGVWWLATLGEADERFVSPVILPSPGEVAASFKSLWFERALMRSIVASLGRVVAGFALAALVGIPLGVLAASFRRVGALMEPLVVFGRNVPIAALIPLTLLWFGTGEAQKMMFIFMACVAFIVFDSASSVSGVASRYVDTAYTLGASRGQVITKVLLPLSLPDIFNSLRLLFGLAFGYVMLAELIDAERGLGHIILMSQRRGPREHMLLVLIVIAIVAFSIDRGLMALQRRFFPYRFGKK